MQGRKCNQKSRNSTGKKSQTIKKTINQKDKIADAIKKSSLLTSNTTKTRISSNSKHTKTQKKVPKNPYQIQSYTHRPVKALSTVSKSMPLRNQKPKTFQSLFEAIKFKQKTKQQVIPNKTCDGFYIQYDQTEQTQNIDMSVLNNSKKILGSYNQRVGRYNQLKSKLKGQFPSKIKNVQFKQALIKLFKFLDPHSNMVISHEQIDYRKLPQGVLYFLGGLFHRIRQKNLLLSQNDFLEECNLLYKRSSNEDVKWFIDEVFALESKNSQSFNKKVQPRVSSKIEFGIINEECFKKIKPQVEISTKNISSIVSGYNNTCFDNQENVMSFRNQTNQHDQNSRQSSNPSEKQSVKSPHFGQLYNRFSFNNQNRDQLLIKIQDQEHPFRESLEQKNKKSQRNSLSQNEQKQIQKSRTVGIKKNIVDKAQDLREQIYTKMDKMKLYPQNKQNLLLKENFISKSKPICQITTLKQNPNLSSENKIHSNSKNALNIKQKTMINTLLPKQSTKNKTPQPQIPDSKMQIITNSYIREPLIQKNTGWVNKVTNCQKAFDQLKKIQQEFRIQKKIVEKKQLQRQSYIRQNQRKAHHLIQDFILEDQTRVLKLTDKRGIFQKPLQRQSLKYERNIDRLAIFTSSRNQKSKTINLNESLANSCRKSLQVSIPLRNHEGQKILSLSEKKSSGHDKFDKIEQLSQRLEKYLKNNAQKIEYSKNFTQNPIQQQVGYNKILAM